MTPTTQGERGSAEPRTPAGRALLGLMKQAVLDPAIHTLLSPPGKAQLVALVDLGLLEQEIPAIEQEAAAAERARLRAAIEGLPAATGPTRVDHVNRAAVLALLDD